jgi:hypothetical protein
LIAREANVDKIVIISSQPDHRLIALLNLVFTHCEILVVPSPMGGLEKTRDIGCAQIKSPECAEKRPHF